MANNSTIDLCAPGIFGSYGGIQTYMRLLARGLAESSQLGEVFSLTDSAADGAQATLSSEYSFPFHGADDSKPSFIFDIGRRSRRRNFLLFGHVALAPIGLPLKLLGLIDGYGVILHGIEAWSRLPWHKRMALAAADLVVSTTPFTQSKVEAENDLSLTNHRLLPLALEPDRFSEPVSPERHRALDRPFELLTVARLDANEQYKGVDHTIEAVGACQRRGVDVTYRIVGDGTDRSRLEALAASTPADEQIIFAGRVSDAELNRRFQQADAFAMPSAGEGFGLVYLEAMHYGLPVIASPRGGAQHVIEDEHDGLMVDYADIDALSEAIERLTQPELLTKLGQGARESIASKYSFEHFHAKLATITETI